MNERDMQDFLQELLENADSDLSSVVGDSPDIRVKTFEEAGVMTREKGILVKINGEKFHITIVKE